MKWHIGCSGFHYKEWKGTFYPSDIPEKKWFAFSSESELNEFYDTIEEDFRDKLGAVLFQLLPKFEYEVERLELILRSVRKGFRNTFEFRHVSWWRDEVYEELRKNKILFCGVNHPKLKMQFS